MYYTAKSIKFNCWSNFGKITLDYAILTYPPPPIPLPLPFYANLSFLQHVPGESPLHYSMPQSAESPVA